jgi:peroxiredoxin
VVLPLALVVGGCAPSQAATVAIPEAPAPPPRAPIAATEGEPSVGSPPPEQQDPETDAASWPAGARGWLGVELEPVAPGQPGVLVLRVVPGSPADRAGLVPGDLLLQLEGETVSQPSDVVRVVTRRAAGTRLGVHASRGGQDRMLAVTLGAFPEGEALVRMTYIGQPAPPFQQLEAAQGSADPSLAAHAGKVVVLEFWAPWCVACRALIPHMNDWHARLESRGLRVFGVTNERTTRASMFARQLGMEFPVLADPSGETSRAYGARAVPMVFVIDRRGMVRDVMVGYDAKKLPELDVLVERLLAER